MKILMINVVCGTKSTGRICTDIAEVLTKQGHEVKIAYGRDEVPEKYKKYAVRIGDGLTSMLHAAKARIIDACGFGSKKATEKFIDWVQDYNPDVIHMHNLHGYYINVEILFNYLRTCNKRIIWTLHDVWAFSGHSALCDADSCERWQYGCGNCPQKNIYPASLIDRSKHNWKVKRALFTNVPNLSITTPSNWMANNIRKSFLKDYVVKVINNGVDTKTFRPIKENNRNKWEIDDKFIVLGVASVWGYKKGFEDFCELAKYLNDEYQIVMVGLENHLLGKVPKKIIALGRTSSLEELVDIYSSADVFVNLTHCDTFPTVNLEARACGLPIITYDTGGSPDAAGDDAYAVVMRGDVKGVVESIKRLKRENGKCSHTINGEKADWLSNKTAINTYIDLIMKRN